MSVPQRFPRWLVCVLLLALPLTSTAQEDGPMYLGGLQFPDGDREFRQNLRRAEEAIGEEQYEDAITLLGQLITGIRDDRDETASSLQEDWFIRQRGTLTSVRSEAQRLLDSIPAKAMRQFEVQHGAEAQVLLEEAFKSGDVEKLADVVRRFFHTEAGYKACLALGQLHLESGQTGSAAGYLRRLVETPAAHRHVDPEASVLLAAANLHSGDSDKAQQVLLDLKRRQPTFELRGAASPAFASDEEALPWLTKIFGRPQTGNTTRVLQWTTFRGNPQRNSITSFAEPTSKPRWRIPIANDPRDEQLIAEARRQFLQQGTPPIPSIQLLAVRNVAVIRGPESLVGIDMTTGKRIWDTRPHMSRSKIELQQREKDASRADQLKQRVWDDCLHGQVSGDGDLVFLIEDLRDAGPYAKSAQNMFNVRIGRPQPNLGNRLVALSLKREGALEWESPPPGKAQVGKKQHPLAGAFFLGAPLAVDGQLYVMAEIRGEIALVVLEAKTGEVKWKQQLGHVETFNVQADPLRRLAGAFPSIANGIVICPTTAGVVVAVDAMNRRLLWASTYSRSSEARSPRFDLSSIRIARFGDRWIDATATIAEGKVIVTPPDSSDLHCLDLATGKAAWPPQPRGDGLFVAGVRNGAIVVVGKQEMSGISLKDGSSLWALEIDAPSGRGVFDENHYYQPTAAGKLLAIDVAEGKIVQEMTTSRPLGNLYTYGDDILSVSEEAISVHPRVDRLQEKIDTTLSREPASSWALARRGELLMHQKKWSEALPVLRKAHAQEQPDSSAQGLLVETMLSLLEQDYKQHQGLATELEKLIDDPAVSDRFQRAVALGKEQAGDHLGAFRALLAIGGKAQGADPHVGESKFIEFDLQWRAREDRWIASRLSSLYQQATDAQRSEMDAAISGELSQLARNSPGALRRVVERFAFHKVADQARLRLADLLIESNNLLEAEIHASDVNKSSDRRLAAQGLATLGQVATAADRWDEAAATYLELERRFGDVELSSSGVTGQQLRAAMQKQIHFRRANESISKVFPAGRVIVKPENTPNSRELDDQRRLHPVPLMQAEVAAGLPPTVLCEPVQNLLRVRDARGHDLTLVSLNRPDNRRFSTNVPGLAAARLSGHLLVLSTGYEVVAVDLLRRGRDPSEVIVWRQEFSESLSEQGFGSLQSRGVANPWAGPRFMAADANNRPLGVLSPITSSGLCFIRQKQLVCVDPATGETIWQRQHVDLGADLFGDEEHLFLVPHGSTQAQVFRMLDGSPAGERKVVKFENRWTTHGGRVLSWSQDGSGLKLSLDDIWQQKNVWSEAAPSGSKAWLCSPDEVGILTAKGDFKIRSLKSDAVKIEAKLDAQPDLLQLYVLKNPHSYLIFASVRPTIELPNVFPHAAGGNHVPLFTGKVYALEAESGKFVWPTPAAVSQMGLPLDQPLDQPVLVFLRNLLPRSSADRQRKSTSVLCLDKRTGAVLHHEGELSGDTQIYELQANHETDTVRLTLPAKTIGLKFTDEPAPPEPPLQDDTGFVRSKSKGPFDAVKRAFFPPILPAAPDPFDEIDPFK